MKDIFDEAIITGADGTIGTYVDFDIRTNHRSLDVTNLAEVMKVCREHKPKLIIHLAAETDVDHCERDEGHAYNVNAVGTYHIALAARDLGAKLVYISTSGVFDGAKSEPYTEDDMPSPRTSYAHSKYLGELAVVGLLSDYLILRIAWVFGGGPTKDQKFIAKILRQIDKPEIKVVSGKRGSPTYGKDLIAGMRRLIEEGKSGLYHMGNAGSPTRADVVREIVRTTGSRAQVEEVPASYFGLPADALRPDNESMVSKVPYMRPWQEALKDYIETEWSDTIR
ncbi:MAG: dTDP-4-dehydrorhamnose reductase [Parcubacteria group bacterium Gr01-1014_91]|nr:MAG: dTDP-4-dehydrorhamnose reductase [Parcubacteria group bacterium Gr01-1014_91]